MKLKVLEDKGNFSDPESRILEYVEQEGEVLGHDSNSEYDVLYSYSPYFSGYSSLTRALRNQVIFAPHCMGFHLFQSRYKNLSKKAALKLFSHSQNLYLRCISKWEYQKYSQLGFPDERLFYCPLGIDYQQFSKVEPSSNSKEIFSLANARRFKNIETQIKAIKELSELGEKVHLNIIGGWNEQEYREEIEDLIENLEIQEYVTIHNYVEREKMFEIMANCEAFIHTSKFETQGLAIYEAAAAGFPICVSDVPVHNQNFERFKHPQGDHKALAEDIRTIFEMDKEKKQEISDEMRELAKDFSKEKEKERLDEFFERIDNNV